MSEENDVKLNITDAVPIPPDAYERRNHNAKWPFSTMLIGESVLLPNGADTRKPIHAMRSAASRHGWEFVRQKEKAGLRIWRIA